MAKIDSVAFQREFLASVNADTSVAQRFGILLDDVIYEIDPSRVDYVTEMVPITPVPSELHFVAGICHSLTRTLVVLDVAKAVKKKEPEGVRRHLVALKGVDVAVLGQLASTTDFLNRQVISMAQNADQSLLSMLGYHG